jgi:hypothetical protein
MGVCTSCGGTSRRRFIGGMAAGLLALVFGPASAFGRGETNPFDQIRSLRRQIRNSDVQHYLRIHLVSECSKILDALNDGDFPYACDRLESMRQHILNASEDPKKNLSASEAKQWSGQIISIENALGCNQQQPQ